MELNKIRLKIDRIDFEIIKLLEERFELALLAGKIKSNVYDEEREKQVYENVSKIITSPIIREDFKLSLFEKIISESRYLQSRGFSLIGFQGEHGANSEEAAKIFDPLLIPIPCKEFKDVVEGVKKEFFEFGILPIENTSEGSIGEVSDLLISSELYIVGEIKLQVNHSLLTLPETNFDEIRFVYSHPQALAQCRNFISQNNFEPKPFYDTAGAAKWLAETRQPGSAVIANSSCKLYGLKVLKENIQDEKINLTRFIVISRKSSNNGDKCSVVFCIQDRVGALCETLKIFSEYGINLSRIESRPNRKEKGKYIFLVDFLGSIENENVKKALELLKSKTETFKFLGCYREYKKP
jgi:prephenate dehydratase/chorismate mutase/prephenate dehydratase